MALGALDQMTFGVPLGFYHLGVGTAHGLGELWQGQYEQATRELAPAALLVALYAGGKGARWVAEGQGARLSLPELRLEALRTWRGAWPSGWEWTGWESWRATFEPAGKRRCSWGPEESLRPWRCTRRAAMWHGRRRGSLRLGPRPPEPRSRRGPPSGALGGVASLVDEAAGHTAEVVEAKLQEAEREAPGPRLPADAALLRKLHATLSSPPPGVPEGYALWEDYRTYRQRRLSELEQGKSTEGPLRWEAYERMRGAFARGLAFERAMVELLRADADLPAAQRQWLKGFNQPRIEVHVGVSKEGVPGLRYADVLVIEQHPPTGQSPRVETFSFKSRYLAPLKGKNLEAQIRLDAQAALDYYGGTLDIRRDSLKGFVQVQRVRLVYQGGELMPEEPKDFKDAVSNVKARVQGVEVLVR